MTDDIRRLLGGYATGTLTEAERQALFEASLQDQKLFEALADEEALKELLEDSAARAALLQAAETPRFTITGALREWIGRPKSQVLVATGCVLLAVIGYRALNEPKEQHRSSAIAELRSPSHQVYAPEPSGKEAPLARAPGQQPAKPVASSPPVPAEPARLPEPPAAVADAGSAALRYTVLRQTRGGEFVPVPEDYLFAPADVIRVRLEATRRGVLRVTGEEGTSLFSGLVSPGTPVVVQQNLSFGERDQRVIHVRFGAAADEEGAILSTFRSDTDSAPRAKMQRTATPEPPGVTLDIVLRRKP